MTLSLTKKEIELLSITISDSIQLIQKIQKASDDKTREVLQVTIEEYRNLIYKIAKTK